MASIERKKKQRVRAADIICTCISRCSLSLLGTMSRYLIGVFPTPHGNGDHGEQDEQTCCCGCEARKKVCGAGPDRIYEQAAHEVSEALSGAVAQKPDGEYAPQKGVGYPLLKDSVGRDVVYAGSGT